MWFHVVMLSFTFFFFFSYIPLFLNAWIAWWFRCPLLTHLLRFWSMADTFSACARDSLPCLDILFCFDWISGSSQFSPMSGILVLRLCFLLKYKVKIKMLCYNLIQISDEPGKKIVILAWEIESRMYRKEEKRNVLDSSAKKLITKTWNVAWNNENTLIPSGRWTIDKKQS